MKDHLISVEPRRVNRFGMERALWSLIVKVFVLAVVAMSLRPEAVVAQGTFADAKIQVGQLYQNQTGSAQWHTVNLTNNYTNPVVVMGPVSNPNDQEPCTIRVRNVTTNSFEYQIDEWDYQNGVHGWTTHHFIAMEAGVFDIGGRIWEAGVADGATHLWGEVELLAGSPSAPVLLAQVATVNEPSAVNTRIRNVSAESFEVKLHEQQYGPDSHIGEDVHFVAIPPGPSAVSSGGVLHLFEAALTNRTISDEGDNSESAIVARGSIEAGFEIVNFQRDYSDFRSTSSVEPILLAGMQTSVTGSPCALKYRGLLDHRFQVRVQAEQSQTISVNTGNEIVGYMAYVTYDDTDNDGLPDEWEAPQTQGGYGTTGANGDVDGDGLTNREEFLNSSNPRVADELTVSLSRESTRVYEHYQALGVKQYRFLINRNYLPDPVTVYFSFGGAPTASKPVAMIGADYTVEDEYGNPLGGSIVIPAYSKSAPITIRPLADGYHEYPERVEMELVPSPANYTVDPSAPDTWIDIADATDAPVYDKILLGLYKPEGGAVTTASGYTTLIMNGTNTKAKISSSFGGLTSSQNNAHVHKANPQPPVSGPVIEPLPNGQLNNYVWTVQPAGAGIYSNERLIDSLFGQNGETKLYSNVHTANYPNGEIWALYSEVQGSLDDPGDPVYPPIDQFDLSTAAGRLNLRRDIARFLTQATFGPTQQTIEQLYELVDAHPNDDRLIVFNQWISSQFALDQTNHLDYLLASDWQEWVLRGYFDDDPNTLQPPRPTPWPRMTGSLTNFDSLNPATWRKPHRAYPFITQCDIGASEPYEWTGSWCGDSPQSSARFVDDMG